jgi:ribonuclease PH
LSRPDGRAPDELRQLSMTLGYMPYAEGSCFIEMGDTKVICTATVEESVPRWMKGKGSGWVTGEYSMLPRSSQERIQREVSRGRPGGRTQEIQRLIGRSLRAAVDMSILGENTIVIDCDVVKADGGTRTASITGGFVALAQACDWMRERDLLAQWPLNDSVAAVSVGIVDGVPVLDLNYVEDLNAQVDMNVVMTGSGKIVEVQGTAEHGVFERAQLDELMDLATKGIAGLVSEQEKALGASEED